MRKGNSDLLDSLLLSKALSLAMQMNSRDTGGIVHNLDLLHCGCSPLRLDPEGLEDSFLANPASSERG